MDTEETKKNSENTESSLEAARDDSAESEVEEFEYNEDGEEDLKKTLKKLRADLKVAKKEKEEYLTGWQKERADFANYKKNEDDRRSVLRETLQEQILSRFLNVVDSFNMAFSNKEAWEKVDSNWRKGVEYIYSQLSGAFEEFGVVEIGKEGEKFDPLLHHSLELVSTDDKSKDHTVAKVIQKGYKLKDPSNGSGQGRVLRPAGVNVYDYRESN